MVAVNLLIVARWKWAVSRMESVAPLTLWFHHFVFVEWIIGWGWCSGGVVVAVVAASGDWRLPHIGGKGSSPSGGGRAGSRCTNTRCNRM